MIRSMNIYADAVICNIRNSIRKIQMSHFDIYICIIFLLIASVQLLRLLNTVRASIPIELSKSNI
jgi:hypothetical protein